MLSLEIIFKFKYLKMKMRQCIGLDLAQKCLLEICQALQLDVQTSYHRLNFSRELCREN